MKPKIMLFDEPTSALDPETESFLVQTLREAAKEKLEAAGAKIVIK